MRGSSMTAFFLLVSCIALSQPATAVYFNPMMSCPQFCQMLTKDYIRQVWCLIDVCKDDKLRRKLVTYSKRSGDTNSLDSWMSPRFSALDYDYFMADLLNKRQQELWDGPTPKDDDNTETDGLF